MQRTSSSTSNQPTRQSSDLTRYEIVVAAIAAVLYLLHLVLPGDPPGAEKRNPSAVMQPSVAATAE